LPVTDAYSLTVELTRGGDSNNRDKMKAKVSADSVEELREKVEAVRSEMQEWADDFRNIQPQVRRQLPDDQSELSELEA
jgi:DNA-directed RNA polymerase alpha subunit